VTVADPTPSVENASLSVPIGEEVAPVLSAEEQLLQLVTQEELDPEKKKIRENLLGLVGRYSESKRLAPKLKGIIPADYQIYPLADDGTRIITPAGYSLVETVTAGNMPSVADSRFTTFKYALANSYAVRQSMPVIYRLG